MRQIGYFEQFKDADTVLITTTAEDAAALALEIEEFAKSHATSLHIRAAPIPGRDTTLMAVREPQTSSNREFRWLCGRVEAPEIAAKLQSLASARSGHQYFELCGSRAQLVVSVGEYEFNKDA